MSFLNPPFAKSERLNAAEEEVALQTMFSCGRSQFFFVSMVDDMHMLNSLLI